MKSFLIRVSTLFCFALSVSAVFAAEQRPHFVRPVELKIREIISGPPAADSTETKHEMEIILAKQATRTPADEARIDREGKWAPYLFDDVLGPWFTEQNLPVAAPFLDAVGRDTMDVCEAAKKLWNRPRPPSTDQRVHPSVGVPTSSSYPSGHGAYGLVLGTVLAELAPDLKEPLLKRGNEIGDDRMIGGVHFASDIEAGRTLGRAIVARLRENPEFLTKLELAKVEFARVRTHKESAAVRN